MINSGAGALDNCQIALGAVPPAGLTLDFQTTDSATNILTGTPDTSVAIPGNNGVQSFLVSLRGATAFSALAVPLDFSCNNAPPAAAVTGVDTVDLTFSATPVADIIALAATSTHDGIVTLPNGGLGAFAVASSNLGATAPIIVTADTGEAGLPVSATICQTNPSTAQCLSPPAASLSLNYAAGTTPTFSVFLQSTGPIAFSPATARIFVRFEDAAGGLHGSTSVAIQTN